MTSKSNLGRGRHYGPKPPQPNVRAAAPGYRATGQGIVIAYAPTRMAAIARWREALAARREAERKKP